MTKEEAIAVLQKIKPIPRRADGKSTTHILESIALDMAINALKMVEIWEGYHGQVVAPRGTFEEIYNDVEDDENDI